MITTLAFGSVYKVHTHQNKNLQTGYVLMYYLQKYSYVDLINFQQL